MRYSDHTSMAALWWKVVFLIPLWGAIPACMLGFLLTRMGPMPTEAGYLVVVFLAIAYFVEDILKRKVKVADGILYFGYKKLDLSKLQSLSVGYETDKIIPKEMILTFKDGYILLLELSRIDAPDIQYLVRLIDTKFPHCAVDNTLRTLARCQELSPISRNSLGAQAELPYHSHRILSETFKGFMATLGSWSRLGPVLVWLMCSPLWLMFTWCSYTLFKNYNLFKSQNIAEELAKGSASILTTLYESVQKTATGVAEFAAQPLVGAVGLVVTLWLLQKLIRKLNQPNLLILDENGINFHQGYRWIRYRLKSITWEQIAYADLVKTDNQPDKWKIELKRKEGSVLHNLEFGALEARGRQELYDRLKHYAPMCRIAPDLAENMMAKQNNSYTELWLQSLSGSPKRDNLDPLESGHQLNEGRYEIVVKLGVGGQGAAYLSRENSTVNRNLCQEVVLKETIFPIFVEESVRKQALERFEHEARTLNLLSHDHIVKLIDYFVEDHRGYLVLELIEGQNLRDHAASNPLTELETIELALQMCEMLEYLHERSVIHRDFTPDNLILERSGTLKLIDFNVAQTQATGMTGTVVGKHAYVPPEQFRGKPVNESDVYAMGCTLFYLLTGHDPEPITQSKVTEERPELSGAIDSIIRKCTSLKAEHRYQSIAQLREELSEALKAQNQIDSNNGDSFLDITISGDKEKLAAVSKQDTGLASELEGD